MAHGKKYQNTNEAACESPTAAISSQRNVETFVRNVEWGWGRRKQRRSISNQYEHRLEIR
jgi:hypothetical protein